MFAQVRLLARSPEKTAAFYGDMLGMTAQAHGLGYGPGEAHLAFDERQAPLPQPEAREFYWKIGITVRDLNLAVSWLAGRGVAVSAPRQFRDIGYLAHLADPDLAPVELLQQGFEGNAGVAGGGHPVGGQATLAHITLRVRDLAVAKAWCANEGLRLMSVQPVEPYGFTLYFYAWSDEKLPEPDLASVGNREWLWARPYTLLELQHWHGEGAVPAASPRLASVSAVRAGKLAALPLETLSV